MADGPLAGFRVLDLTQAVSGPFCTMMLGDLGADVIKVEAPTGDTARLITKPGRNKVGAYFLMFNRNKRGIVIDVRKDRGRDLIRRLAARSDALVENNRPGVADRLGIGYADIRKINPRIVYCAIHGFGPNGPLANAPAYDPVIQGFTGMATVQGGPTGNPTAVKMVIADKASGFTAAIGVVAALHAARSRGVGQYLRVPMVEAMFNLLANDTMVGYAFMPPDEFKHQTPKNGSLDPFRTKDGYVAIAPYSDEQWQRLLTAIGHPEWWEVENRRERLRTCLRGIAKLFPERESAYWLKKIEEADCPGGPVHSYDTLLNDPEVIANESFTVWEHPQAGQVRTVNPGMRFSETPAKFWRRPPGLGEHTEEVLRELGLPRNEIEELRADKVIN
ncbi:MAG TPA: CoA transferase [Candidatus Binataceae bacterium]|jgi:formyl-CoA transferase|nr:CoA transferase [Candidatus Binataceae bacterium]